MTVITISRQYGSGGRKIATRVADLLGYRFFDKRLMEQVAVEVGLSSSEIVDYSEENYHVQSFFEKLLGTSSVVGQISSRERDPEGREVSISRTLDEAEAVDLVRTAVQAAYRKGNVVIVGRGAQVILRDEPDAFHVRVIAPMETRMQRLEQNEGISYMQGRSLAVERDEATLEYMQRFFNEHPDNPFLYDLIINTGKWTVDAAAEAIVEAVKKREAVPA